MINVSEDTTSFFGGGFILIFEINLYWTWDCRTEWNMPLDRNRRYIPLYNQEMQIQYMCMLESFKHDGNCRNIFLSGGELICRPINKINQCFITGKWYVYARKYMNLYELKGISFLSNFVWYKISYYFWTKICMFSIFKKQGIAILYIVSFKQYY